MASSRWQTQEWKRIGQIRFYRPCMSYPAISLPFNMQPSRNIVATSQKISFWEWNCLWNAISSEHFTFRWVYMLLKGGFGSVNFFKTKKNCLYWRSSNVCREKYAEIATIVWEKHCCIYFGKPFSQVGSPFLSYLDVRDCVECLYWLIFSQMRIRKESSNVRFHFHWIQKRSKYLWHIWATHHTLQQKCASCTIMWLMIVRCKPWSWTRRSNLISLIKDHLWLSPSIANTWSVKCATVYRHCYPM